ncbi:MAG TPA: 2-oxoglutarate oxidoreductase, partial [Firmicutes bacterium]|nr:2-oxoglutarate oxidoreductase [Bacillota bacterium]
TTTSPFGRDPELAGYPIRISEMLATLTGAKYVVRTSVHNPV